MWTVLQFLIGTWEGEGSGQSGSGHYERSYELILDGTFILEKNKSTYPPQEQNPQGEVHEDWGVFSRDKTRKTFVLRQFHSEGFINQYVMESMPPDSTTITFTSESIENIAPGWRARETYQIISPDEFVEVFELAEPGKDFEEYSRCHLHRNLA